MADPASHDPAAAPRRVSDLPLRGVATIAGFDPVAMAAQQALPAAELECRLVEIGFVEGATVEVAHLGGLRGDPMGVRIDGRRLVALRRREAQCILVVPGGHGR